MPINTESLNNDLYRLLSKYKPKPLDAEGKVTPVPEEADIFKFDFTKDGKDYGTVFVTLDDNRVLTLYFGDDVTQSPDGKTPGLDYDDTWWGLYHQLSAWRITKGLKGFESHNKDRVADDMAKRKHMKNKDKIAECYYATGKKSSYSDAVPSVKIVIEHSRVIEEGEQRYRNINRIFLENQAGERYLLDTKKPGIARVYARHIAEGGKVNDDRWSHIGSLCEEYQKMAGFVRATRNGQFNESAQSLVNEGIAHYASLRESLSRMTGKRGYNAYFESWTPALMEDGTEENNLNELFVQETLDPRIESVMPILNRIHKKVSESAVDKEMNKLAEWADSLVEEGGESLTSNNPIGIPEDEELDESEMDESALQAWLGDKKYGEKGMDALRTAGRKHASKTKMQNIRAKFSNKEKDVAEGHQVVPGIDREKYTERPGLEGPFHTKSGKVVYYDKQEGKYYDPSTDFYISHDEWQAMNEDVSEAKGLAKKVKVVKGEHAGKTGWIREIKHGAFKGAPKTYYIDLDDGGQANNLPATSLRLVKDVEEGITADIRDYFANPGNDTSSPFRKKAMPPEDIQLIMLNMKQRQPVSKADQYRLADWLRRNQGTRTVYADVNESDMGEGVIYQLDKENPMSGTEVLVIGGAGRYSLDGLRAKARKEVVELAKDLEIEHGGAFRRSAQNIKQLQNTLNTIVAAYDELNQIRKLGGMRSKGIKDEDAILIKESMDLIKKALTRS